MSKANNIADSKFGFQFSLNIATNSTFIIDQYASFDYTILSAVYQTSSGTVTANVKINGTSVTGLSELSLTSSEAGPTSATALNDVVEGDTVVVTLSSNSNAVDVSIKLNCVRR
jgi:hypothetical protein